jgi:hypothetical protein
VRQEGLSRSHERIHGQQCVTIAQGVEIRHPPHALAQDPHHGADVGEFHAAPCGTEIGDGEPGALGRCGFLARLSCQ